MKLNEVMTKQVESIDANATLREAAEKMRSLDVGFLPVMENGHTIGVVTDRDIIIRAIAFGADPSQVKIIEVTTINVESLPQEEELDEAARLMQEKQIRRLLVLDERGYIAGVVSLGDLAVQSKDPLLSGKVLEQICEPAKSSQRS